MEMLTIPLQSRDDRSKQQSTKWKNSVPGMKHIPFFFQLTIFFYVFFLFFLPNQIKEYIIFELVERGK